MHQLKFGADLSLNSYDQTTGLGSSGAFAFSGPSDFAQLTGAFTQTLYTEPRRRVFRARVRRIRSGSDQRVARSRPQFGSARGRGGASPGRRRCQPGVAEGEWPEQYRVHGQPGGKISPRFGFTWDVGDRHSTVLQGITGVYYDEVDPGILGDVIRTSLGDSVRSEVGSLPAWPGPTSPEAPGPLGPGPDAVGP